MRPPPDRRARHPRATRPRASSRHSRLTALPIREDSVRELLDLLDWRRQVFALYAEIRAAADPEQARGRWHEARERLFRDHPQSPQPGYDRLECFPYDPSLRYLAEIVPA